MDRRLIGCTVLTIGTTLGGGALALPVALNNCGLGGALLLILISWALMTLAGLTLLEVKHCLPPDAHFISMANATLGKLAAVVVFILYGGFLSLLLGNYALNGAGWLHEILAPTLSPPVALLEGAFVILLAIAITHSINSLFLTNRLFSLTKLAALIVLLVMAFPHSLGSPMVNLQPMAMLENLSLGLSAFSFAIIVPSLHRIYPNKAKMQRVIWFGGTIPLVFYLLWTATIFDVLPYNILHHINLPSGHATSDLTLALESAIQAEGASFLARVFITCCFITSFLTHGLSLMDTIRDGCQKFFTVRKFWLALGTFTPALLLVLLVPYWLAPTLQYGGLLSALLLFWFPMAMGLQHFGKHNPHYRWIMGALTVTLAAFLVVTTAQDHQRFHESQLLRTKHHDTH